MEETPAAPEQPEAAGKEAVAPKEPRRRKKRLLKQIADQMDFYFSAANITKDRFMSSLLSADPYIDLQTFFKFNKLRSMTTDVDFLRKAISKSSILELSEDGLKVRRKTHVEIKNNELQCTIYVENIPSNADHDWIREVFGGYGTIDYISVPRFHRSGRPKGFAFVEFKTPEMANIALEAFGALKCKIAPTIDPGQLQSIKTFEGNSGEQEAEESENKSECDTQNGDKESEHAKSMEASGEEEEKGKKRKLGDGATEEENEKKRRVDDDDAKEEANEKKRRVDDDKDTSDNIAQQEESMDALENKPQDGIADEAEPSAGGKKSKKKKRKRNKKGKEVIDSIYLRVMSKEDWKKLRNKYLNTQRENMKLLKMQLQDRHQQHQYWQRPGEWSAERDNNHDAERDTSQETTTRSNSAQIDHHLKPQFTPNSVIKISFEEPPQDPKKLRETIREGGSGGVAYVDVSATERDVYVRFLSEEAATSYKKTGCWSRMEVLSGAEEEEYWERIISCWTQRRTKKSKQSGKQSQNFPGELRGREKLLQKALKEAQNTKCNSHIVFDD
ncbi:la-related protein 7-like isoform X2 [Eriocheir sinensis]|uniref:la-related protein 7-like isoform X2 n=1 Tax=Eriocheir sinensis TaxID=95602 RepID=UPI0021C5BD31|nr:la-related protein 7-like isoform X2 [Eriocheir sinensis]